MTGHLECWVTKEESCALETLWSPPMCQALGWGFYLPSCLILTQLCEVILQTRKLCVGGTEDFAKVTELASSRTLASPTQVGRTFRLQQG